MSGEPRLLDALDVAVGVVVEDDGGQRDALLHHGGELLDVVEKTAVTVERDYLAVRQAHLRPQRRREAVTQRALVTGREERPRLVDREARAGPVANLSALLEQH